MAVYGYGSTRTNNRYGPYVAPAAAGQAAYIEAMFNPDGGTATATVLRAYFQRMTGVTVTVLEPEHASSRSPNQQGGSGTLESVTGSASGNPYAIIGAGPEQTWAAGHYQFPRPAARLTMTGSEVADFQTNALSGSGIAIAFAARFVEGGGYSTVDRVARRPREHGWWHRRAAKSEKVQAGTTPPASRQSQHHTQVWNILPAARSMYLREPKQPLVLRAGAQVSFGITDQGVTGSGPPVASGFPHLSGAASFNTTVNAGDNFLTVWIETNGASASAVSFDGVAMYRMGKASVSGLVSEVWGLANPHVGASLGVAITGLSGGFQTSAWSFQNVGTAPGVDAGITTDLTGVTNITANAITGTANGMIVAATAASGGDPNPTTSGATEGITDNGGESIVMVPATGAPQTLTWSNTGTNNVEVIAIALPPTGAVFDTVSASKAATITRSPTDNGVVQTDTVAPGRILTRAVTDTGTAQSDSLTSIDVHPRNVTDTGTTFSDTVTPSLARQRAVTDTGDSQTDSVTRTYGRTRNVTDTADTQTDTVLTAISYDVANSFTTGSQGATISAGNSGGVAGVNDAFEVINGAPTYDNAHAHSGTQSGRFPAVTPSQVGWNTKLRTGEVHYGRCYIYFNNSNAAQTRIVTVSGDVLSALMTVAVDTVNALVLVLGGGSPVTSAISFTIAGWARLEWRVTIDRAGNATARVRQFLTINTEGTVPDEEIVATASGLSDQKIVQSMVGTSSAATATTWFDDFEVSNVGWIGPFGGAQSYEADLTDAGVASFSDAIGRAVRRGLADTGTSQTDSVIASKSSGTTRNVTDTGESQTDAIGRAVVRGVASTGVTQTDTLGPRVITRAITDTGAAQTDSLGKIVVHGVQDDGIGWIFTDPFTRTVSAGSLGGAWVSRAATTAQSVDGSEAVFQPTGAQQPEATLDAASGDVDVRCRMQWNVMPVGATRNQGIRLREDSGQLNNYRIRMAVNTSGTVNLGVVAVVANTPTTLQNNAVVQATPQAGEWWWLQASYQGGRLRVWAWKDGTIQPSPDADLTDTSVPLNTLVGLTAQRLSGETTVPVLWFDDFSYRVFDSVSAARGSVSTTRNVSDTGTTQTDSIARSLAASRAVTDTGESQSDTVVATRAYARGVTDTGASQTDSVAATRAYVRGVTDTGEAQTDAVAATRQRPRGVTDTGTSQSDTVAATRAYLRGVTDTGASITDAPGRAVTRKPTDTGVTFSDRLGPPVWKMLGRVCHGGVTQPNGYTNAQNGQLYGVFVCNYIDRSIVASLKSLNPSLQVYCYFDPVATDSADTGGQASGVDYAVANNGSHNDWFLLDSGSARINHAGQPTTWMTDIGLRSYQDGVVSHILSMVQDGTPWDGIFLDEIGATWSYSSAGQTTLPALYPTEASWQAAMFSFFARVGVGLQNAGYRVMPNISDDFNGSPDAAAFSKGVYAYTSGYFEESWTDGGAGLSQQNVWTPFRIALLQDAVANHKTAFLHSHNGTEAGQTYALATGLCFGDISTFQDTAQPDYASEYLPVEYTTAIGLGYPTGAATVLASGGTGGTSVYRRDFTKGIVLSNTQPASFGPYTLGGTYTGSGFTGITSITLAAHTGVVLLAVGAVTRSPTDTGVTPSDSIGRAVVHGLADTGASQSDSVVRTRLVSRAPTDTGVTQTDTIVRTRLVSRGVTDTGTSFSDTLTSVAVKARGIVDYGIGGVLAASDAFARTITAGQSVSWGTADTGQTWNTLTTAVGSTYGVNNGATNLTQAANSGRRGQYVTGLAGSNMTAAARFSLDVLPIGAAFFCAVLVRVLDIGNYYAGDAQVSTAGNLSYRIRKVLASATTNIFAATASGLTVSAGGMFWIRTMVEGTTISVRLWLDGTPEPTTWNAQVTDPDVAVGTGAGAGGIGQATVTNNVTETIQAFQVVLLGSDVVGRAVTPTLTDTGLTQTDSVSRTVTTTRGVTDAGTAFSDSVARTAARSRGVADTGSAQTDTVSVSGAGAARPSDVGTSFSDSVAVQRFVSRPLTDTGVTPSDSVTRTRLVPRGPVDTGTAFADAVATLRVRALADTGASQSDSVARSFARTKGVTDSGVVQTDAVARLASRGPTDTGVTQSDSIARTIKATRGVTDTGDAQSDAIGTAAGGHVNVTDQGVAQTDTVRRTLPRGVTDTGLAQVDAVRPAVVRPLADVGEAQSDTLGGRRITRAIVDVGVVQVDAVVRVIRRGIADAGTAMSDAVAAARGSGLVDTGATIIDTVARLKTALRPLADTGVAQTDVVQTPRVRGVTDIGTSMSESIRRTVARPLADRGVTQTDSPSITAAGKVGVADSMTITDLLGARRVVRHVTDTGAVVTDSLGILGKHIVAIVDQGVRFGDTLARRVLVIGELHGPTTQPQVDDGTTELDVAARVAPAGPHARTIQPIVYAHTEG